MMQKFEVRYEQILLEDNVLVSELNKYHKDMQETKLLLDSSACRKDDYLQQRLARLAYCFSRENYTALQIEAKNRGLILT